MEKRPEYVLDAQIGYVLRRVTQRHLSIFSARIPRVTTTQWAAMARLFHAGPMSQNMLGRETAMDAATIKGVVDRLVREGLVDTAPDPKDRRRLTVTLSQEGRDFFAQALQAASDVSDETLAPLAPQERTQLLSLLARLA